MKAIPSLAGFPEISREAADPLKILFIRVQMASSTDVKPPLFKVTVLHGCQKQPTSFENQCDLLYGTLSNLLGAEQVLTVVKWAGTGTSRCEHSSCSGRRLPYASSLHLCEPILPLRIDWTFQKPLSPEPPR